MIEREEQSVASNKLHHREKERLRARI